MPGSARVILVDAVHSELLGQITLLRVLTTSVSSHVFLPVQVHSGVYSMPPRPSGVNTAESKITCSSTAMPSLMRKRSTPR